MHTFFYFLLQILQPPSTTIFPYTTLFRSQLIEDGIRNTGFFASRHRRAPWLRSCPTPHEIPDSPAGSTSRSEDHTSELPSPDQLVCRHLPPKNNCIS